MNQKICSKCSGAIEKIARQGQEVFYFCRPCKLPHDEFGNPLFTAKSLADRYNPLQAARDVVAKHHPHDKPVVKTALEVALLQSIQEAYFSGLKDGVLLAYSQDYQEGDPMMEKLGVSNEELATELRNKYTQLKERQEASLTKEASAQVQQEIDAIKAKLDELGS
jgi:hypothetical protein